MESKTLKKPQIHYRGLNSFTLYSLMGKYKEREETILYNHIKEILQERDYFMSER